jgi:hypothetical protein
MLGTGLGRRNTLLIGYGAVLMAVVSCQLVAGISTRKLDPVPTGCALPAGGAAPRVRFADLVPTSDVVDVCVRASGTSSFGRPLVLDGGSDCGTTLGAAGFKYGNVTIPFGAPGASVDVKVIAAGTTCDSAALAEGDGLTLATNAVTTLIYAGGAGGVATGVVALPESDVTNNASQSIRFVHAAPGTGPLDFAEVKGATLPTTVDVPLLSAPVSFGGTAPPGTTAKFASSSLGDNGYFNIFTAPFQIGASIDGGDNKSVFAYRLPGEAAVYSMYVVGVAGDNVHPLRALVCDEDPNAPAGANALLIGCATSQLSSISVDLFNPALYGGNAPYFRERGDLVPAAMAARDADIMCVVEVDEEPNKNAILQKVTSTVPNATGPYGFVYTLTTNLSTTFTHPEDQSGNVPPKPAAPPCSGVDPTLIDNLVSCGEQKCDTNPGDPTGVLYPNTSCLVDNCAGPFINVQGASVACYDCLVVNIASDSTYQQSRTSCTTDNRPPLGFGGAMNSMIISKYPLLNSDALILPSTLYRRSVLYSQVQLEDQTIDFYCGFLMTTLNYSALPYAGAYGGNPGCDPAQSECSKTMWQNEQLWEAQQLVNWVGQKSGSATPPNPAILVGDWRSSIGVSPDAAAPAPGTNLPVDLSIGTMNLFKGTAQWTFATPPSSSSSWTPQCNFCPIGENPYNGATDSYFVAQPMLAYWPGDPTTAATDMSLVYTQPALSLGNDAGQQGPVSPYYGVNVRIIRPK